MWDTSSGDLLSDLVLHGTSDVYVLTPHPTDHRIMVSAGYDHRVLVWQLPHGKLVKGKKRDNEKENESVVGS